MRRRGAGSPPRAAAVTCQGNRTCSASAQTLQRPRSGRWIFAPSLVGGLLATSLLAGAAAAKTAGALTDSGQTDSPQATSAQTDAAQTAGATSGPLTPAEAAQLREQLRALRDQAKTLGQQADALERRLDVAAPPGPGEAAAPAPPASEAIKVIENNVGETGNPSLLKPETWGLAQEPGKGFVVARTNIGELDVTFTTYLRYLNQTALAPTYTNFFGKTTVLDLKSDVQFNKVNLTFKGWLFNEKFRYLLFVWTNNTTQGEGGQVVLAGWFAYDFSKLLTIGGGVDALPSTRSTTGNYPNWLRNDNRLMADEFFRGSYTNGLWAEGKFDRFQYRVMAANNLSALGISSSQLAPDLKTYSAYLRWMPTTGEFGPVAGFGDYENHQRVATDLEAHYTYSREDAQEQPGTDSIENSQIRLSDGERLFDPGVFGTPFQINKATYQMMALTGAVKYKGLSFDSEYYVRWVNKFEATGPLPYTHMYDTGISLQASDMVIQKTLQAYATYSHIWGQFGSPNEFVAGLNWYPFERKNLRITPNAMWFDHSPVGYSGVPYVVGGKGWAFYVDVALAAF
jgi:hypothetical protein